jgi:hypothetical protein
MRWRDVSVRSPGLWAAAVVAPLAAGFLLTSCSGRTASTPVRLRAAASAPPSVTATSPSHSQKPKPKPRPAPPSALPVALPVAPGAGRLAQTQTFPSTKTVAFRNAMDDL